MEFRKREVKPPTAAGAKTIFAQSANGIVNEGK